MKNKILLPKSKIFLLLLLMATLLAGCEKDTEPPMHPNDYFTSEPFSVSATKQVRFSQGNLQYQASTNTWRFAEHQYDIIGNGNENISPTYSGWIDLFGLGTSGYNNKYPYITSRLNADYVDGDIANSNYDWGVYIGNSIINGASSSWRTLTNEEWKYLFDTRSDAASKRGHTIVHGVTGMVLLPDSWTLPTGCSFTSGYDSGFTANRSFCRLRDSAVALSSTTSVRTAIASMITVSISMVALPIRETVAIVVPGSRFVWPKIYKIKTI